jgi:hypothetical protein
MSAMGVLVEELITLPSNSKITDMEVIFESSHIRIDQLALIACEICPIWEGRIKWETVRKIPLPVILSIRESLLAYGTQGGFLGILHGGDSDNRFMARALKFIEEGTPEKLVGCGPGLTPAGDDFLTGAILASSIPLFLDRIRLEQLLQGTTPAGRTLLWMAVQGRFPAYVVRFIDAIVEAEDSVKAITRAVRAACTHGATSGTDMLAGFCWQMLKS